MNKVKRHLFTMFQVLMWTLSSYAQSHRKSLLPGTCTGSGENAGRHSNARLHHKPLEVPKCLP